MLCDFGAGIVGIYACVDARSRSAYDAITPVGAVYDRAYFVKLRKMCAVIDRAYSQRA